MSERSPDRPSAEAKYDNTFDTFKLIETTRRRRSADAAEYGCRGRLIEVGTSGSVMQNTYNDADELLG